MTLTPGYLFYVTHPSAIREVLLLRDGMRDTGTDKPLLLLSHEIHDKCQKDLLSDFMVVGEDGKVLDPLTYSPPPPEQPLDRLGFIGEILALARRLSSRKRAFLRLLKQLEPRAVLVCGDRFVTRELPFLWACKRRSIPVLQLSLGESEPYATAYIRHSSAIYQTGRAPWRRLKRLLKLLLPNQFYGSNTNEQLIFYRPSVTIALFLAGILPKDPWHRGLSGFIDVIGAARRQDYDYLTSLGVPTDKLLLSGQPSLDTLFRTFERREVVRAELGVDKRLIVCAVPQHWENIAPWSEENYQDLVDSLGDCGCQVILSLHPKMTQADYAYLKLKDCVRWADRPLAEILPAADVYVATDSSTLVWAALLAIPTVIIDFTSNEVCSPLVAAYPYFFYATNPRELRGHLTRLVDDPVFHQDTVKHVTEQTSSIAPRGGNSVRLIVAKLRSMAKPQTGHAPGIS